MTRHIANSAPASPRTRHSLNGWWDFQPVPHADLTQPLEPDRVPADGWSTAAYLVPGFFSDPAYPAAWRASRSGWMRTRFQVGADDRADGRRAWLLLKGTIPRAFVFVNGRRVAVQEDMFIGEAIDVTDAVHSGENELAVFLTEFRSFPHPSSKAVCLIDVPWGCCISTGQAGLWQDVSLEWRPALEIADIAVSTSVRRKTLTVRATVVNRGSRPVARAVLTHTVLDQGREEKRLDSEAFDLPAGGTREVELSVGWDAPALWSPEQPTLYELRTGLRTDGGLADEAATRFGFREVWIEWHRILLNGRPQRWAGEWCHKEHPHWLRPEYVRKWYGMLKDLNMSYVRMHTFPHPDYFLDIADEMGILVCQESALHGSGQAGWETPELWPRAEEHLRRLVRRDRNHPSLVIYSVENEMRWSLNVVPGAKDRLPGLRRLLEELDPTRPAYHEGDSSLWNEDDQSIISRHYGPACHGWGWWDRRAPLHAGEMGRWHYASPFVSMQWAGDEVHRDYALLSRSVARDSARIIELGRANEVSCMFPWNISGLDNLRPAEPRTFTWSDPSAPAAKPLAHAPYESEFAWWEEGRGYRPGASFEVIRHALRPVAVVIREERTCGYAGRPIRHTIYVVNDLPGALDGTLSVRLTAGGRDVWAEERKLSVPAGGTGEAAMAVPASATDGLEGPAELVTLFSAGDVRDEVRRALRLTRPDGSPVALGDGRVGVMGRSAWARWLRARGVDVLELAGDAAPDARATPLVIIGERAIEPGSQQCRRLREFVEAGGRALVMEQDHTLFAGVRLERRPIEMAFVRDAGHPILAGVTNDDLKFFGDDPFGLPSSDAWVTVLPYVKPRDAGGVRVLVDSSGGDFGSGGLAWAPVIEVPLGRGTLVASQLRLSDRLDDLPLADRFMRQALDYLAGYRLPRPVSIRASAPLAGDAARHAGREVAALEAGSGAEEELWLVSGAESRSEDPGEWRRAIEAGRTVVVWGLTPDSSGWWSRLAGRAITCFTPGHPVFHLVSESPSPLLAGLSNEDTCWIDAWPYTGGKVREPAVDHLLRIDGADALLVNEPKSCLDVMFGDNQCSEWLRAKVLSRHADAPLPPVGAGLTVLPIGRGRVVFCQLRWKPEIWMFRRTFERLLWNLGVPPAAGPLSGDATPTAGRLSAGHPDTMRAARLTPDERREALSLAKRRAESYAVNMPFREWSRWTAAATPGGRLSAASLPGTGDIVIGMEVVCSEPRKFMETLGGLPNPDLQTFLRLDGAGAVTAWINGREWGRAALDGTKPAYIADIDLEAGSNFVVLSWAPASPGDALGLCFENKDRRPETAFSFA